jgi:hypothetical protein
MDLRGAGWIALVSLLAAALFAAAPAAAKKKAKSPPLTTASATQTTSSDNQQLTVTAHCPSGLIAVGGGFLSPPVLDAGTPTDIALVYESRRAGDGAWQVSAVREDEGSTTGPDLPLTAIVDCRSAKLKAKKGAGKAAAAKKKKKLRVIEASAPAVAAGQDGAQASAIATCPGKTKALGGGFSSSPTPSALSPGSAFPYFWSNHRTSPTTWSAAISNVGSTARTVTSYVYCAAGLKIAETTASVSLPASGPTVAAATATSPACPKGRALLGGGFNNTPATDGGAIALLTGSSPVGGTWQLGTLNLFNVPGAISTYAYCA